MEKKISPSPPSTPPQKPRPPPVCPPAPKRKTQYKDISTIISKTHISEVIKFSR